MTTTTGRRAPLTTAAPASTAAALLDDTDRCVKCALCLPVCPTYQMAHTETRSPRGRISIIQGLARGQISPTEAAPALDSCLSCRACESVCPARVPYGSILDRARAQMVSDAPRRTDRHLARLLQTPAALRVGATLGRWTRSLPLPGRLARWQAMIQAPRRTPAPIRSGGDRGIVYLATGCVTDAFDRASNDSLTALLGACGYLVRPIGGCCGALSQHGGHLTNAHQQSAQLAEQATDPTAPVIHAASGCAAALHDAADAVTPALGKRVVDPFELMYEAGIKDRLRSAAIHNQSVALHQPCTQRNVLGAGGALHALLDELGAAVTVVNGAGCCGAAGTHMLTHADDAAELARTLLAPLSDTPVDILLSANIGCAWHLRGTLYDQNQSLPVLHPAVFLAGLLLPAETVAP